MGHALPANGKAVNRPASFSFTANPPVQPCVRKAILVVGFRQCETLTVLLKVAR